MPTKVTILLLSLMPAVALASWYAGRYVPAHSRPAPEKAEVVPAGWNVAAEPGMWQCIVIHHSATEAGGAARFDRAHRSKGWDELGYHFVIGNGSDTADGQVEVGPRWTEQKHGAHCYTASEFYNQHGIGICLVGNLDLHPPTPAQQKSLQALVRFLCRQYSITPDHVLTHGGVTGKTRCPGDHFDLEGLRASVSGPQ